MFKRLINLPLAVGVVLMSVWRFSDLNIFSFYAVSLAVLSAVVYLLSNLQSVTSRKVFSVSLLPVLYLVGLFGSIASMGNPVIKGLLGVLGAVLFYFYQLYSPRLVPRFLTDAYLLATAILVSTTLWSINFFFPVPGYLLLLLGFAAFGTLFWQTFILLGIINEKTPWFTLTGALIMVEVTWVLWFWPVNFLTAAVMSFSVFYALYVISDLYFRRELSARSLMFQGSLVTFVLFLTLITANWTPS